MGKKMAGAAPGRQGGCQTHARSSSGHGALLGRSRQGSPATFLFLLRGCHRDLMSSGPSGSWNLWQEREKTMSHLGCLRVQGCTPDPEVRMRN